jgi:hypothetical protein
MLCTGSGATQATRAGACGGSPASEVGGVQPRRHGLDPDTVEADSSNQQTDRGGSGWKSTLQVPAVHGAIRTTSALQRLAKQGDSEAIGEALVAKGTRVEPLVTSLREVLWPRGSAGQGGENGLRFHCYH